MTEWIYKPVKLPSFVYKTRAEDHQQQLTKPPGSLGRLEALATRLASLQHTDTPSVEQIHITIFAGDHGIANEGVSAFPQSVTGQMVHNFSAGGAAVAVLAKLHKAQFSVVNTGVIGDLPELPHVINTPIAKGTQNFAEEPAMSHEQLAEALQLGRDAVEQAAEQGCQLWIGGEMGIANTTSATAIACTLLNQPASELTGPGTGLGGKALSRKMNVIDQALALHATDPGNALQALNCFGGFEIAALTGAYITAAQQGIPVLVDGFICTVAARAAMALNPGVKSWLILSHHSVEPGHTPLLDTFEEPPLLDLSMRLGEASGAAVCIPILQQACALHNQMATFADASVDDQPTEESPA